MSKITVIGAGNGGMAMAYSLGKSGHEVCIYDSPKFPAQVNAVKEQGGIEAVAELNDAPMLNAGFAKITLATTDIKEAMEFADIVMMVCPSFAQEIMFDAMLPHLRDGMKIFIVPGNYGGLILNKKLSHSQKKGTDIIFIDTISLPWATRLAHPGAVAIMGVKEFMPLSIFPQSKRTPELETLINDVFPILNKKLSHSQKKGTDIIFIDTISLPWATRLAHPGAVAIMGVKEFMPLSIFPQSKRTPELETLINDVFPILPEFLANPVVAAFENINFGAHPVLSILNMGICENYNGQFSFYGDCCSTAVAKVEDALDRERMAVGESLHMHLRTELEANNSLYASHAKCIYDFNRQSSVHSKIKDAPASSKARYITEDVPFLFVPFCELADLCGIEVPIAKALVTLASYYNDEDYMKTGRTLAKMGFNHWTKQEILEFLEK